MKRDAYSASLFLPDMQDQTFHKEERLSKKKDIQILFSNGNTFFQYPFKILWIEKQLNSHFKVKVLIGVSKKNFKLAVNRNKVKRIIKEAYRKNKYLLFEFLKDKNIELNLGFIYTGKEMPTFKEIEQKLILILHRIKAEYEKGVE